MLCRMVVGIVLALAAATVLGQTNHGGVVDAKVEAVLERMRGRWRDLNVPEADGRILHDIIVEHGFRNALEVGTSTGHSGLWIGWALSKTGGRLITIEIDAGRHREAVEHFEAAGLSPFIDARLGDAHDLVPKLSGPFDFVFIDADKDWYVNYAKAIVPQLSPNACLTAHNVRDSSSGWRWRGGMRGTDEFFAFMKAQPQFDSFIHPDSRNGVSVSCRR